MTYDFHPVARQELEIAVSYYDSIDRQLGDGFLDEFERTVDRIIKFPEAWASLSKNTRRCRMNGFPYGIVYRVQKQQILILAVMHLQRKPNYWKNR